MLNADSNIGNSSACTPRAVPEISFCLSLSPSVHKASPSLTVDARWDTWTTSTNFLKTPYLSTGHVLNCAFKNDKLLRLFNWGAKVAPLWDGDLLHLIAYSNSIFNIKIHIFRTIRSFHSLAVCLFKS